MSTCTRHTEHARRDGDLVGRSFLDMYRFPEGHWDQCDSDMADFVYCKSHLRVHETGWCGVGNNRKIPLLATTYDEAVTEARDLGLFS